MKKALRFYLLGVVLGLVTWAYAGDYHEDKDVEVNGTTYTYDLIDVKLWVPESDSLDDWHDIIEMCSKRIWNYTERQVALGRVEVYHRDRGLPNDLDIRVDRTRGAEANILGLESAGGTIHMPRFGADHAQGGVLAHEFGHYVFGFYDEYAVVLVDPNNARMFLAHDGTWSTNRSTWGSQYGRITYAPTQVLPFNQQPYCIEPNRAGRRASIMDGYWPALNVDDGHTDTELCTPTANTNDWPNAEDWTNTLHHGPEDARVLVSGNNFTVAVTSLQDLYNDGESCWETAVRTRSLNRPTEDPKDDFRLQRRITGGSLQALRGEGVPDGTLQKLETIKDDAFENLDDLEERLQDLLSTEEFNSYSRTVLDHSDEFEAQGDEWPPFEWVLADLHLSIMMCVDRSGSMLGQKFSNAQRGAEVSIQKSLHRRNSGRGDNVGLVSYSWTARIDVSLSELTSQEDKDTMIAEIQSISAGGNTAIGDGLRKCLDEFVRVASDKPAGETEAVVLLSDGLHNTGEDPDKDILTALRGRRVRVFTIGLGNDADTVLLQRLADETRGRFWFVSDPSELQDIFTTIYTEARQEVTVSTVSAEIDAGVSAHTVRVDEFLSERAEFLLTWTGTSDLDILLVKPDGTRIDSLLAEADPNMDRAEGATYEFVRVHDPDIGEWIIEVVPSVVQTPEQYVVHVTGRGPLNMVFYLDSDKGSYVYPEPVRISGLLTGPVTVKGAQISGTVLRPDGTRVDFALYDDGVPEHGDDYADDGRYANFFSALSGDGFYRFEMRAVNATGMTVVPGDSPYISLPHPGEPLPISEAVPSFSREAQITLGISNVPQFIDATAITSTSISLWRLNWSTGTLFGAMSLTNNAHSTKSLKDTFWYAVRPSDQTRLMNPDGRTGEGLDYVDITNKVLAALPQVGDRDSELDPGEMVTVPDIEFYSRDRSEPQGFVFAVWADPPAVVPPVMRSVLYDDDSSLLIMWNAVQGATYRILSSEDLANWQEVGTTQRGIWRDKTTGGTKHRFYKLEVR